MRTLVAAVLIALLVTPCRAWETDLHYGLTKWLAVKAGFSLDDAEDIAAGAQDADDGPILPAPHLVERYMCFGSHDVSSSRLVQHYHFPSYAALPDTPPARNVTANSDAASRWTRSEIVVDPKGAPRNIMLFRFGNSLHPLEDSWSHNGVPDIALVCDDKLAWGHPKTRGGVLSHDADITYKHVQDTEQTAQAVFDYLVDLRKKVGGAAQSASWSSIQSAVHQFAQAATKTDKLVWFQSDPAVPYDSYKRKCFLNHISIPDGPKYQCPVPPPSPSNALLAPPSNDADKFTREFLQQWIVEQKIDAAVEQMDRESVGAELGVEHMLSQSTLRDMLLVWLNRDHGIANETGHGMRGDLFTPALRERLEKNVLRFSDIPTAIRSRGTDLPYLFSQVGSGGATKAEYTVTFEFRTAPRDTVSLGVAHRMNGWKVVLFTWVAL